MVTEINSKNELVVLDNFEAPPPPPSHVSTSTAESAVSGKAEQQPNTLSEDAESAVGGQKRKQWSARPEAASVPPLEELVTPEHYHSLQELALSYKGTLVHDPDQRVELGEWMSTGSGCGRVGVVMSADSTGIINDKERRGCLHFAIYSSFPILSSITYKSDQV